jgi:hypothetical protein
MALPPYPLPRETRETGILNGSGVASYGPFTIKIFDENDVEVWRLDDGATEWALQAVTVTKTADLAHDTFSITFPAAVPSTTKFRVSGRRLHERQVAVTRGGAIDSTMLEKELSKQGAILQELRRDLGRTVRFPPGFDGQPFLPVMTAGKSIIVNPDADGLTIGPNADEIAAAQGYAEGALASKEVAVLAQGYAEEWAQKAEDAPVSVPAGGDGSTDFSALHWAKKAEGYAAVALNNWSVKEFAGDGVETVFDLEVNPGIAANVQVSIYGIQQRLDAYVLDGTTIVFNEPPPGDGEEINIEMRFGSAVVVDVGTPTDASVTTPKLASSVYVDQPGAEAGAENTKLMTALRTAQAIVAQVNAALIYSLLPVGSVVQRASNFYTAYVSTTSVIPWDNTVPQSTEGTEYLSATIIPKSATNRLRVRAIVNGTPPGGGGTTVVAALFKDAETSARAAGACYNIANAPIQFPLEYEFIPGSVAPLTMRVRIGPGGASTIYINGAASGRIFGGVQNISLVIEEIKE